MPRRNPLSKRAAGEYGLAACRNVTALLAEAWLLAEHNHHARAYTLSVLSAEELAKAWVAQLAQWWGDDPDFWPSFWAISRGGRHANKLEAMLTLEKLPALTGGNLDDMAQDLIGLLGSDIYATKNRSMYVDFTDSGQVLEPSEIGDDPALQTRAKAIRKAVTVWVVIIQGGLERDLGIDPE